MHTHKIIIILHIHTLIKGYKHEKTTLLAASLLLATLTLSANSDGQKVFDANCKACHMMKPMMDKNAMMKMSKEDRMSMKEKMMKTMKAPPMSKVSAKLKHDLKGDKAKIVTFIKDYIVDPDAKKSHCMPMVYRFSQLDGLIRGFITI